MGWIGQKLSRLGGMLWRVRRGFDKALVRAALPLLARKVDTGLRLETLGSSYGGWTVPVALIDSDWVCYCVGVGVDATFDVALTERFGCQVHSFDPTPRSIRYMERLSYDRGLLHFHPLGVWVNDTQMTFYAPAHADETSHSLYDLHGQGTGFTATCKALTTLMRELGHERIDLLKIDIEGAWYEVTRELAHRRLPVRIFCVEFDSPSSLPKVLKTIRLLGQAGLRLVHHHKNNYLFMHDALLNGGPAAAGAIAADR